MLTILGSMLVASNTLGGVISKIYSTTTGLLHACGAAILIRFLTVDLSVAQRSLVLIFLLFFTLVVSGVCLSHPYATVLTRKTGLGFIVIFVLLEARTQVDVWHPLRLSASLWLGCFGTTQLLRSIVTTTQSRQHKHS